MINLSAAGDDLVRPLTPAATSVPLHRTACEPAIAAMRAELEEYGALLNLLDRQQTAILDRAWETLQTVNHMIAAQHQVLRARRSQRGKAVAALAPLEPLRTLAQLAELIPPVMRPLVEALTVEAARLKKLTVRRLQHNERMLGRAQRLAAR